jgi:hypothetical protein
MTGRPQGKLIAAATDGLFTVEIQEAMMPCTVVYQGRPFTLKRYYTEVWLNYGPKYPRLIFSSPGHAWNLANKLNMLFGTTDFTVVEVVPGRTLTQP